MASDWGEVEATGGFEDRKKLNDLVPIIDKNDFKKKYKPYRFIGGVQPYQEIWLPIYKDGKPVISPKGNKPVRIPKYVTNYDLETHKINSELPACPYVELAEKMNKYLDEKDQLRVKQAYLANAIDREFQDNPPKKMKPATKTELKSKLYEIDSPSTKMVEVFDMTPSLFKKIKGLKSLNKSKVKSTGEIKEYNVTEEKKGCDVNIKFDPDEKGGAMYDAQKADRTPLTEEELEYPLWDISSIIEPESYKEAKKEADRLWKEFAKSIKGKKNLDDDDEDLPADLEEDDEPVVSKKKKKKAAPVDEDDEGDDDDVPVKSKKKKKVVEDEDEDDEDDIKPKKKKAKKPVDEDEDDDDDVPFEVTSKSKKKKKPVDEDEDDEDEPDVDLDDDEDEPIVKRKKSKKPVDEDDEDDEDEVKPKKKSKKPVDDDEDDEDDVKPKKKKAKKPVDDDEDEDDDDLESLDDDEDDEDEEEVKPKKKKKTTKKPVDDDEDEDDDD